MNLAIVHYHFNRGGVTQVVLNHLHSLETTRPSEPIRVALIYGGRRAGLPDDLPARFSTLDVSLAAVARLEYDDTSTPRPDILADELRATLQSINFVPESTVVHVHNHSLGKNHSVPQALAALAEDGYRLLLHIHDFAEDFRPANYRRMADALTQGAANDLPTILYPQAEQIHYAALNRRDLNILEQAGVDRGRRHFVPNPVAEFGELPSKEAARRSLWEKFGVPVEDRYFLYPVRGIRRKNLGEAILWSVLAGEGATVGFTLAPLNPFERGPYDRWKEFARSLRLRCAFETGADDGLPFLENLAAADRILTTSVAEGFGLVFLESWLAGRMLVGRDLPEITADFVASGVRLETLQSILAVPVEWVGEASLTKTLQAAFSETRAGYGLPPASNDEFLEGFGELIRDGAIDFACLNSELQRTVIRMAHQDAAYRDKLRELNLWVEIAAATCDDAMIQENAKAVRTAYSLEVAGGRLLDVYRAVLTSGQSPIEGPSAGHRILESFLAVSRLHPIRLEG